ncbi:MAG: mechanosensitive ion channel family protein [Prevotella sp.]|nr:mechanosensitive ion channel family protein [Prevotella sp.]MDY5547511.1 mechanosensitive ion channel family protein [Prevotella sp.]
MKRFLGMVLAVLWACLPASAVLKERNLSSTLSVLRAELESSFGEQKQNMARYYQFTEMQHKQMISLMQRSDQISLMLYSQKQDFTFDMTYACHEATDLYKEFNKRRLPYDQILQKMNSEIERYTDLINSLMTIPPRVGDANMPPKALKNFKPMRPMKGDRKHQPFMLDKQGQADRAACLGYAIALRRNLEKMKETVIQDSEHYKMISKKLKQGNDYALQRYNAIQHSIFINGDASYLEVLGQLPRYVSNAKQDADEKYTTEKVKGNNGTMRTIHSQWRGPIVVGLVLFVMFYIIVAALLSNVLVRWLVPKRFRTEEFMKKKVCLILAAAMIIFAITIMIARCFMYHNFFLMASKLLIEYSWLLSAIFVSLLVRLPGDQIKSGFRIYTPIMLMSFIVIAFRIIFIPNNVVQLIFPPILLLFTLWQWNVITRHNDNIPKSDIFYTWISLLVMVVSTLVAWYGYTLLSVQTLIWWTFLLTCIQTITCFYDLLAVYEERVLSKKIGEDLGSHPINMHINILEVIRTRHEKHINKTWAYDLVSMVVVPVIGVFSIFFSIWWAADVFDLTETVVKIMTTNFLNVPDVVQLSLLKLVMVASQFFVFRYLNYLIKALYHKYHKSKIVVNGKPNFTLANNIIAICVWGTYFIISIKMLRIPSTAISVISAGLATGVGFAMKDLLENFFYGISLMTGRVRVGDFIECDGIRGKVDSITYQSTQVVTADGCVIAFLNSSLFSKNFKNITKNHSYELVTVPVGVAYGSNIDEVRKMLIEAVKGQMKKDSDGRDLINTKKPVGVVFDEFGDNSVNLFVTYWVLVEQKFIVTGEVKEAIYNTLNAHHIEIPFPQRDLHIRSVEVPVPVEKRG